MLCNEHVSHFFMYERISQICPEWETYETGLRRFRWESRTGDDKNKDGSEFLLLFHRDYILCLMFISMLPKTCGPLSVDGNICTLTKSRPKLSSPLFGSH